MSFQRRRVLLTGGISVSLALAAILPLVANASKAPADTTTAITHRRQPGWPDLRRCRRAQRRRSRRNSRLLADYPATQQSQVLDCFFKPGDGADLQILKVEIGGDANSTDGAEPSIEHTAGTVDCATGYEFWLMEQAKARKPNIKLYSLSWGAPGWIGAGNFWSTDMIAAN
jgi:hypothetical protein